VHGFRRTLAAIVSRKAKNRLSHQSEVVDSIQKEREKERRKTFEQMGSTNRKGDEKLSQAAADSFHDHHARIIDHSSLSSSSRSKPHGKTKGPSYGAGRPFIKRRRTKTKKIRGGARGKMDAMRNARTDQCIRIRAYVRFVRPGMRL